jgi:hypothetical protein
MFKHDITISVEPALLASYAILGKYWFLDGKNDFFIADFRVSGLFIVKKHDLSEKKIRLSRAVAGIIKTSYGRKNFNPLSFLAKLQFLLDFSELKLMYHR